MNEYLSTIFKAQIIIFHNFLRSILLRFHNVLVAVKIKRARKFSM